MQQHHLLPDYKTHSERDLPKVIGLESGRGGI